MVEVVSEQLIVVLIQDIIASDLHLASVTHLAQRAVHDQGGPLSLTVSSFRHDEGRFKEGFTAYLVAHFGASSKCLSLFVLFDFLACWV